MVPDSVVPLSINDWLVVPCAVAVAERAPPSLTASPIWLAALVRLPIVEVMVASNFCLATGSPSTLPFSAVIAAPSVLRMFWL